MRREPCASHRRLLHRSHAHPARSPPLAPWMGIGCASAHRAGRARRATRARPPRAGRRIALAALAPHHSAGIRTHCAVPGYAGSRSAYRVAISGGTKRPVASGVARHGRQKAGIALCRPQLPRTSQVVMAAREGARPRLGRGERHQQRGAQAVAPHVAARHVPACAPRVSATRGRGSRTRRHRRRTRGDVDAGDGRRVVAAQRRQQGVKRRPRSALEAEAKQRIHRHVVAAPGVRMRRARVRGGRARAAHRPSSGAASSSAADTNGTPRDCSCVTSPLYSGLRPPRSRQPGRQSGQHQLPRSSLACP